MPPREKTKPRLPVRQLCILAVVRIAEPLALTSVFPYLPEMIRSFGVERDEVAKWAGITSAIFSISQSMTAVLWGRTSDTIGRKPTLMLGMLCTMLCFLFWGTASSLAMAITIRAIQGCGNGNVGIIRTVVAELVPEKSLQPVAFSIMPMVWSVGSVFGPAFGGFFAQPAKKYPRLFGDSALFNRYPFLLPNLIAGVFFTCSLVTAFLFLRETLESKRHRKDYGLLLGQKIVHFVRGKPDHHHHHHHPDETTPLLVAAAADSDTDCPPDGPTPPPARAASADSLKKPVPPAASNLDHIFNRQTSVVLLCYTFLALHSVAYDQVVPVFLNYPYQSHDASNTGLFKFTGGFGMSSGRIGTMFTITALISGVAQFVVFPPLCSRYGELKCYRVATAISPLIYFITPYTVLINNEHLRFLAFMVTFVVKGCIGIVTFPCITIILTNSAPSLAVLGTLNGFATTVSGVGRALGPAMTGAAFTWGVQRGYIITGWWLLAIIATIASVPPFFITQGSGFKHSAAADEESSESDDESLLSPCADDDAGHVRLFSDETRPGQLTPLPPMPEPEAPGQLAVQ